MNYNKVLTDIWPDIYRYTFYKVQNKEEAEEITQETFERVYKKLKAEVVDPSKVKSYCLTVANNIVIDKWRKKGRRPKETNIENVYDSNIGIPDKQKEIEDRIIVQKALEQLPEIPRQVLIWRIVEGYSIQEVANRLGKSTGSIKSIQFRALKSLKEILKEGGYVFE